MPVTRGATAPPPAQSEMHWRSLAVNDGTTRRECCGQYRSAAAGSITEAGLGFSADRTRQKAYSKAAGFQVDETTRRQFSIRIILQTLKALDPPSGPKSVAQYQQEQTHRNAPSLSTMGWNT